MSHSREIKFTDEQLSLIDGLGSQYVQACPGAGKTQALAERYARRPNQHPRRGVGLISFTNAATEEAQLRCSENPQLLRAPNFVGTIDKFVNRFIVSPALTSRKGIAAHFVDVWSQLPNTLVQCKGIKISASLDWFEFDTDGSACLSPDIAPSNRRKSLVALNINDKERLEARAKQLRNNYIGRGYFSAEASRHAALFYLKEPTLRKSITRLLAYRFAELIVDEVQDCSDDDIQILEFVQSTGVHLVLVGDPDQAIYDFRGRSHDATQKLDALATAGKRLSGNFRSTPAICAIANSLRSSLATDEAVGHNKLNLQPVLLLKFGKPASVPQAIAAVAASNSITNEDCLVLAHGRRQAATCAGASIFESTSDARLQRIALAIETLRSSASDGKRRKEALTDLRNCFHESAHDDYKNLSTHDFYEAIQISEREFFVKLLRIAHTTEFDRQQKPSIFKSSLVKSFERQGINWIRLNAVPTPKGDVWSSLPSNKEQAFNFATIHNYKGLQHKFVTVVVPENRDARPYHETGVGQWCLDQVGEPRRVLYVGVSRAEEILMLAVHESEFQSVHDKLTHDGVPFEVVEAK